MNEAAEQHEKYISVRQLEVANRNLGVAQLCKDTLLQLVTLSQELSEHRQSAADKIPKHVWQSYKNAFLSGGISITPDYKVWVVNHQLLKLLESACEVLPQYLSFLISVEVPSLHSCRCCLPAGFLSRGYRGRLR